MVDSLQKSNLDESLPTGLVDTCTAMADLINAIAKLPTSPPSLYIDLKGVYLSRHGSISILQVHFSPDNRTYLIDIHILGGKAFSTARAGGQTLKGILESDSIPKVFSTFVTTQIHCSAILVLTLLVFMTSNSWNSQHELTIGDILTG